MSDSVYDVLRQQEPDFSSKVVAIAGDVSEIRLGISNEDWNTLTKEVNVIFHVAATTRFDEKLQTAIKINIRGTSECLMLGKECDKLCSFVHVSTAFGHATKYMSDKIFEEKFYKSPVPPDALISMAEQMDVERFSSIASSLTQDWPNTYTYTKAASEELVQKTSGGLPICIVRPAGVIVTKSEPTPGWLDWNAVYSITGVVTGIVLGMIHIAPANENASVGLIPCDYVNNAIIVAGKHTATSQTKGGNDTSIYTVTSATRNPLTYAQMKKTIVDACRSIASPLAVGYCYTILTTNRILFGTLSLLLLYIPASVADFICFLLRKERGSIKQAKNVNSICKALFYFSLNTWQMDDDNTTALYENLSKQDKIIFNFDVTDINWNEYIRVWILGIRKYILKDGLKNTEYAIKKQKRIKVLQYIISPLYAYYLWKVGVFAISTLV